MNTILQVNKHKIIYILTFALLMSSIGIGPTLLLNLIPDNKGIIDLIVTGIRSIGPILTILIAFIFIYELYKSFFIRRINIFIKFKDNKLKNIIIFEINCINS